MKATIAVAALALFALPAHGAAIQPRDAVKEDAPNGYAPVRVTCPVGIKVRRADLKLGPLAPEEAAYISRKTASSVPAWKAYLENVGLQGLNITEFVKTNGVAGRTMPNVAFALSGGGYKALMHGASILAAFDGRNATAVAAKIGGIQQLAQYASGLSGGALLLGSWAEAGYPTLEGMRDEAWDFRGSFFTSPLKNTPAAPLALIAKASAGYPVSALDLIAVNINGRLLNTTSNNPVHTTYHSIREQPQFQAATVPYPLIVSLGVNPDQFNITLTSPGYEFSPHEFAVNHPSVGTAAVPIEYLGTAFRKERVSDLLCTTGFDNSGIVTAASGNIVGGQDRDALAALAMGNPQLESLLGGVPLKNAATTVRALQPSTWLASSYAELNLVDGGFGKESTPYFPLLQPSRMVDVIIAADGNSPYSTYTKSLLPGWEGYPFPIVPNPTDFVAMGLNKRPGFFGSACTKTSPTTPLIVYLPLYSDSYDISIQSAALLTAEDEQGTGMGSALRRKTWLGRLVSHAHVLVDGQQARNGVDRTEECSACFTKWCYVP
ncbi:hypothetical protein RQP46_009071 [Phenoliferia psychrophenolica]